MPQRDEYIRIGGRRVPLERRHDIIAVRYRRSARAATSSVTSASRRFLQESRVHDFLANHGIELRHVRSPTDRTAPAESRGRLRDAVKQLDREDSVKFAAMAYRFPGGAGLVIPNNGFLVRFKPGVSEQAIDRLNTRYGVRRLRRLRAGWALEALEGDGELGAVALANTYIELHPDLVDSATPDLVRPIEFRRITTRRRRAARDSVPAGAVTAEPWHLETARVAEAWDTTRGDSEITVAILDDGVDVGHPEFAGKVGPQFDFETHLDDARPKTPQDNHGTACAGVAVARGETASGVAPGCRLMAVRTPAFLGVVDEVRMFEWTADQGADVISCSWGPADGDGAFPLTDAVREAIHDCATRGRGGRGIPIFWAAGNGNESVSGDGYATHPDVMAIAASTSDETRSWYSDFGPEIWVCAPSSGDAGAGEKSIFTTDRRATDGYNAGDADLGDANGNYTNDFGGTSSACPLAAGVAALMLSANRHLEALQVRAILRDTADKIGVVAYDAEGHSREHGYGRVNAARAVERARDTAVVAPGGALSTILAPASHRVSTGPPSFEIELAAGRFFSVELATEATLFDAARSGERDPDNYYASWEDSQHRGEAPYALPEAAWERLQRAPRLYYRLHTSSRADAWEDARVSVEGEDLVLAPFIELVAGTTERTAPPPAPLVERSAVADEPPTIEGPERHDRGAGSPFFHLETEAGRHFAVEVAVRPELFDRRRHGDERRPENFYASWEEGLSFNPEEVVAFRLPEAAWKLLRGAEHLCYRVVTCSSDEPGWPDFRTSLWDADHEQAPWITLEGGRVERSVQPPPTRRQRKERAERSWRRRRAE